MVEEKDGDKTGWIREMFRQNMVGSEKCLDKIWLKGGMVIKLVGTM